MYLLRCKFIKNHDIVSQTYKEFYFSYLAIKHPPKASRSRADWQKSFFLHNVLTKTI